MRVIINNGTGKLLVASAEIMPICQDAKQGISYLVAERESQIPIGLIELKELSNHELVAILKLNNSGVETSFKIEIDDRMDIDYLDEIELKKGRIESEIERTTKAKQILEKVKWRWQSARLYAIAVAVNSIGLHLTMQFGWIEFLQGSFILNWLIAIFLLFKKTPYEK